MAFSGVRPSPSARRIQARRLYSMTIGMPANMILRYKDALPMISAGVCRTYRTGITIACPTNVRMIMKIADRHTELPMTFRSISSCFAPNSCAIKIPKPCVNPCMMPSIIQLSQSDAPSAASACTPSPLPTTIVSTTVYNCWKILPAIRENANDRISGVGFPSVIFLI